GGRGGSVVAATVALVDGGDGVRWCSDDDDDGVGGGDVVLMLLMVVVLWRCYNLPKQILEAQIEAQKPENIRNEDVEGMIRKDIPKEKRRSWNPARMELYA
ncbi:hypothetical protein Tco_0381371, partial [Tanacetum coccineum]